MQKAGKQLDGAKFHLHKLQDSLDDSRAFYHHATALLNSVYAAGESLKDEVGERRYEKQRNAWGKTLSKEERLLMQEIIYSLRGKSVHAAAGISLYPSAVRLTSNTLDNPATITFEEGSSSTFQVSIPAGFTGVIGDITGAPPSDADILAQGPIIHTQVLEGDSTTDLVARPEQWRFGDSNLFPDAISICSQVVELAGRFLQVFRA